MISLPGAGKQQAPTCTLAYKHSPETKTNTCAINHFTLESQFHRNLNKQTASKRGYPSTCWLKTVPKQESLCVVPIKRKTALVKVKSKLSSGSFKTSGFRSKLDIWQLLHTESCISKYKSCSWFHSHRGGLEWFQWINKQSYLRKEDASGKRMKPTRRLPQMRIFV